MTRFMMMAAAAAMVLFVAPTTASANQCIPEGGNGRLICPFLYFQTGQTPNILTQTTTTVVKKPKVWWPKGGDFKSKFGKFGTPKFGAPKLGAPKFGALKFGGAKFGGSKFGFKGSFGAKGFAPKGMSLPRSEGGSKFGKYGGYGKHRKHVKTTTQTKHYDGGGRKGPSPLASYALAATWCSAGSLVLNAIIVNATENRELTRSEAGQTVAGCWMPILGPILATPTTRPIRSGRIDP